MAVNLENIELININIIIFTLHYIIYIQQAHIMKAKFYVHNQEAMQLKNPVRFKSRIDISLPKVGDKEIYVRTVAYQPKKIIQFQQPEQMQFWGLVTPIYEITKKRKTPTQPDIIKHQFNRSELLLTKYMDRKQMKSNEKIQTPTTIISGPVYGSKTSRASFSIKKRKLSTRLPSTSMSENQCNETQEFFKRFDEQNIEQKDIDLNQGIGQIINMSSQKKYKKTDLNIQNKQNKKKFRKYSEDQARKNIWNQ